VSASSIIAPMKSYLHDLQQSLQDTIILCEVTGQLIIKLHDPVRSKIVISNIIIEQVNTLIKIYLGCSTANQNKKDYC